MPLRKKKLTTPDPVLANLDAEIVRAHTCLADLHAGEEDHALAVDQLVKLYALRAEHIGKRKPVSADTLATVAGQAVIALVVVGYESKNVVSTQVHKFLPKLNFK